MATDLLAGRNPYDHPYNFFNLPYPLPAAVCGLPFVWLPKEVAVGLFFGISAGLLAFAITQQGYTRLLIFLSAPFLSAFATLQWSPLIAAAAFFPVLSFLVLVKPQAALPIVATRLNRTAVVAIALVAIASLLAMPSWPVEWLDKLGFHVGSDALRIDRYRTVWYVPLLTIPGIFILPALTCLRDRDARVLLLASLMPHNTTYDLFILWVIPRGRSEVVWTTALSWGLLLLWFGPSFLAHLQSGFIETATCFLPMVWILLIRQRSQRRPQDLRSAPVPWSAPVDR